VKHVTGIIGATLMSSVVL